jgi:hypothetical protein
MSLTPIPVWMKQAVIDRDGTRCLRCECQTFRHPDGKIRPDTTAFDHIVPECKGGMTTLDNLQLLCTECNQIKGSSIQDFRRAQPKRTELEQFAADTSTAYAALEAAIAHEQGATLVPAPRTSTSVVPVPRIVAGQCMRCSRYTCVCRGVQSTEPVPKVKAGRWAQGLSDSTVVALATEQAEYAVVKGVDMYTLIDIQRGCDTHADVLRKVYEVAS